MNYTDEQKNTMIEDLWNSSSKKLFNYLGKYNMSREEREDTVSEAFARAFKSLETFKGTCKLESWLFQIAKNIYLNKIRYDTCKKRIRTEVDTEKLVLAGVVPGAKVTNPILEDELNKIVESVIKFKFKKRPVYIDVMTDIFINHTDLTHKELAEAYGVTAMSIRREKYRLGKKLVDKLRTLKAI